MKEQTVGDLKKFLKGIPDSTKLVTASDEEGNSYSYVYYSPTKGRFDGETFIGEHEVEECKADGIAVGKEKVLCIN